MGWFKKKEEGKKEMRDEAPSLPELPRLPEFGNRNIKMKQERISQLPSFPNNSLGMKFSQDSIKEAVSGGKEVEEDLELNNFTPKTREVQTMPNPQFKEKRIDYKKDIMTMPHNQLREIKQEPVFIRIDKFEESADSIEEIKIQMYLTKLVESDIKVTEKEIDDYLASQNSETSITTTELPTREEINARIKQQKLQGKIQTYLEDLKAKAKINYFVKY